MATFAYAGRTRSGNPVRGVRVAENAGALAAALRREHVVATSIRALNDARRRRVNARTLAVFTRQLSVMIDAGLPLVQSLELLAVQEPDRVLSEAITQVRRDVEGGSSLAEAMARCPHTFDVLYTHMVGAGEAAGVLDSILHRLSVYLEKQARLTSQLRSAMSYPAAVLSIAALVVLVILWKVIPMFTSLFEGLNAELPLPTRIVIHASKGLIAALPFMGVGIPLLAYGAHRYYNGPAGRLRIDGFLLSVPLLGGVLLKASVARFCRTFGTLTGSGVPILDGLSITAKTAGNAVVESAIRSARGRIERGETIAAPLKSTGVFPPLVAQMVAAGESAGALDAMLGKIADFYEEDVDVAVASLLGTLEPALIVLLGLIVGSIVVSLYLPLFSLISQLSTR